jgi:hypothetical protein
MSVPLTDLHVKYVVDFTIKTVLSNPDRYISEIFGDAALDPHAALLGDHYINRVKNWIKSTHIPVILGFELDPAQIPGITIHLQRSTPAQSFMGDMGFVQLQPIQKSERMVAVPAFSPKKVTPSADGSYVSIILPDGMDPNLARLIIPNFHVFDKNQREYKIGIGPDTNPTVSQVGSDLLKDADLSRVTVVSPYPNLQIREGVMYYDDTVVVACHGHADRNEGLWLWCIVQWGLLKYRPLLTAAFGLDLAMPTAADFSKDDSFLGENVWTRYVTLSTKSVWSWSGAQSTDLVAFLTTILEKNQEGQGPADPPNDLS